MSYSAPKLDESGIHLPTYQERLESLLEGYKAIFGSDLYIDPDTMDYQALAIVAKCWDDLTSVILDSYNSRDPNFASGTALDLLLPLNGIVRREATSSKVVLKMTSNKLNWELPSGMQAMDNDGYIWEVAEPVIFTDSYDVYVTAYCTTKGAISAGIGTITKINTPADGWQAVTNEEAAIPGRNVETDAEVRKRRSMSMALPAQGMVSAIHAAILNLEDVESVNIVENYTDSTDANGIPSHSICVVVEGGSDEDIAKVIWLKKAPGTGLTGTETVNYRDDFGVVNPIKFRRASKTATGVRITFNAFGDFDKDTMFGETIPAAIKAYINGLDIGEDLIATLLNAPIYAANTVSRPVYSVTNIEVKENGGSYSTDKLAASYHTLWKISGTATVTHVGDVYTLTLGVS